jgi:hypothetical protein
MREALQALKRSPERKLPSPTWVEVKADILSTVAALTGTAGEKAWSKPATKQRRSPRVLEVKKKKAMRKVALLSTLSFRERYRAIVKGRHRRAWYRNVKKELASPPTRYSACSETEYAD